MSLMFFLIISGYWILKPLKKSLFIEYYKEGGFALFNANDPMTGSEAEMLAKVLNLVVAVVAVAVFSFLAKSFKREKLMLIFCGFFSACYAIYYFLLPNGEGRGLSEGTAWTFYLFGDLFATLMVATFFAFLNDSVAPGQAKRLYGLVIFGGTLGGAVGSMILREYINKLSASQWMLAEIGWAALIAVVAWTAGTLIRRNLDPEAEARISEERAKRDAEKKAIVERTGHPALIGAKLVFRSPYLLAIVAIVGLYEMSSQIMDFQFTSSIEHFLTKDLIGSQFADTYATTNLLALVVQLFLTSLIMQRFGVTTALLIPPLFALAGSGAFFIVPVLAFGQFLNTADNALGYSVGQSGREALYTATTREEKYYAKAFIDMFVQRFAKVVSVGISLIIVALGFETNFGGVRWLTLATFVFLTGWIFAAAYAGQRFKKMTSASEEIR